jgi:glycosyltransferase involved in cell wall biosynthesis
MASVVGRSPLVSVLLPARDAADTLPACLRSLGRQRLTDWECVLVDDGSSDGTASIASSFGQRDPRFRLVRTPPHGLVAALEEGLARCRGRFVARMDADDIMHADRLAAQVAALDANPRLDAVGSHVRMFPRTLVTAGRRAYETWINGLVSEDDVCRDAFVECPVAHPTLMARTDLLRHARYRDAGWPEDYDLVLRLLAHGTRIAVVPRRLVGWRERPERLSRVDPRYGIDSFTRCKAAFLATGFLQLVNEYVLWGYGDTGRSLARSLERHEKRLSHVVEVHPGRVGQQIAGAPVVGLGMLPALRGRPIVVSVAGAGPRAEIRAHLAALGFVELRDFICAA